MAGAKRKNWSYEEITAAAEKKILYYMEKSRTAEDARRRDLFSDWAWGVYSGWCDLVGGYFSEDAKRLEELTKA